MNLRTAFEAQARNNAALGSPFTARILRLLGARLTPDSALGARLHGWPGDIGPSGASLPLRLLGGLHALVLGGASPALIACYPPNRAPDDAGLWAAIEQALAQHETFLNRWIDSPPQTNEVRRSAALIAAGHWLADRFGLPLVLSELGASAGLNLNWDAYALRVNDAHFGPANPALALAPDWRGAPPPLALPQVVGRRGADLNPLNPADPDHGLRLLAYLWADQPERLARTRAAMALPAAPVDRADAAPWLERRLASTHPGALHLVYHTIAWQYFPPQTRAACSEALEQAGARATQNAPLAHLAMEADGAKGNQGAALTLRLWPQNRTITLARVDFHGRWLDWQAD